LDPLDDFLTSVAVKTAFHPKKILPILREAYTIGVPVLIAKSMTDRLGESGGFAFHLGTTDPQMRRITSWLFTCFGEVRGGLQKLLLPLWKRGGREDFKLVGLILANLDDGDLQQGVWSEFFSLIKTNSKHSLESLLEIIEEIHRTRPIPNNEELISLSLEGGMSHQTVILVLIVGGNNTDFPKEIIKSAAKGGELFERIRQRLLNE
jgi:hypothetical protein